MAGLTKLLVAWTSEVAYTWSACVHGWAGPPPPTQPPSVADAIGLARDPIAALFLIFTVVHRHGASWRALLPTERFQREYSGVAICALFFELGHPLELSANRYCHGLFAFDTLTSTVDVRRSTPTPATGLGSVPTPVSVHVVPESREPPVRRLRRGARQGALRIERVPVRWTAPSSTIADGRVGEPERALQRLLPGGCALLGRHARHDRDDEHGEQRHGGAHDGECLSARRVQRKATLPHGPWIGSKAPWLERETPRPRRARGWA